VLILLPPSEGKTAPRSGAPLDPAALSLPELNPARERVLAALSALCAAEPDREHAAAVLGLGPTQHAEVARNAGLRQAPTVRADRLYTGVLYEALDLPGLPAPARRQAQRSILVFSALWGVLRPADRIPAYRLSGAVRLPGLGPSGAATGLGTYWRGVLAGPVSAAAGRGPVLDLRSSAYAAMWAPTGAVAARTATVRVLHERVTGGVAKRTVVSHFNKATKGRLVRDLLLAGARPGSVDELVEALRDLKYQVEPQPLTAAGAQPLDVVVSEL